MVMLLHLSQVSETMPFHLSMLFLPVDFSYMLQPTRWEVEGAEAQGKKKDRNRARNGTITTEANLLSIIIL